jgi:hypothetical protein
MRVPWWFLTRNGVSVPVLTQTDAGLPGSIAHLSCMLCSVYAGLGVCCTQSMLHFAYAACIVNWWWCRGEIERDDLSLCACIDGRVMDKKKSDGGWKWERYAGYEWLLEIRSTTDLNRFRSARIGVITRRIRTCTCCIPDGPLTWTQHSIKSQVLIISPISSDLSLSLTSPQNTKISHRDVSLHAMILS